MKCWHGYQSGFVIETTSATLIFDWTKHPLPTIPQNKPLHIFISHVHEDHFDPSILSLANTHKDVTIYLGYDDSIDQINDYIDKLPKRIYESILYFDGECELDTHFGKVESLTSTDLGVAYLVKVDGMTLYHAGDLFPWNGSEIEFLQYTAPLQGVHIDYAMLPMDPRFPGAAEQCISHYLKLADITYFTPMHLWNKTEYASTFAKQNPQYCGKMIAVNPKDVKIRQSIKPLQPFTITLEAPHTESIQKAAKPAAVQSQAAGKAAPEEAAPTQTREELLYAIGQYYAADTLEAAQRLDLSITNIFEIRKQDDATLRALLDDLKKHASC